MTIEIEEGTNVRRDVMRYEGREMDVFYVQEPRKGSRGELTVGMIFLEDLATLETTPVIAVAERGPSDQFNLELGRKVAYGRLMKKLNGIKASVAKSG